MKAKGFINISSLLKKKKNKIRKKYSTKKKIM